MPTLEIDVSGILRASGASNRVYLIPSLERPSEVPLVCIYGGHGPGTPERAYHHRWWCLGRIPADAVPDSVLEAIQGHESEILAIAELYEGHEWDGNNHVGRWRDSDQREAWDLEIQRALSVVRTYWEAGQYFAPLGAVDQRMRALADLDSLDAVVSRELENASEADVYLEERETRRELLADAQLWLERYDDPADDQEQERALRARLLGWLA